MKTTTNCISYVFLQDFYFAHVKIMSAILKYKPVLTSGRKKCIQKKANFLNETVKFELKLHDLWEVNM